MEKYVEITSTDAINWSLIDDPALPSLALPVTVGGPGPKWSMGRKIGTTPTDSWANSTDGLSWVDQPLPIALPGGVKAIAWNDSGIGIGVGYHYGGDGTRPIIVRWQDGVLTPQTSPFDGYTVYQPSGDSIFIDPQLYDVAWGEGLFVVGGRAVNEQTITPGPAWEPTVYGDNYSANPDGSVTWVPSLFHDNGYRSHFTLDHYGLIEITLTNCGSTSMLANTSNIDFLGGYVNMSRSGTGATQKLVSRLLPAGTYGMQIKHPFSGLPPEGFTIGRHSTVYHTPKTIMTSPDGINWTNRSNPWANVDSQFYPPQPQRVLRVKYGGGKYIAIGSSPGTTGGITTGYRYLMSSSDGTTWTARHTEDLIEPRALAYSPSLGQWVVFGGELRWGFVTSSDGVTWTFHTDPFPSENNRQYASDVVWSPNHSLFILVGQVSSYQYDPPYTDDTNKALIATSPDGVTWTKRTQPFDLTLTSNLNRIAVDGNRIVAVGEGWAEPCVPPANNDFADAELLVGDSGSVSGTNTCATFEAGEPAADDGGEGDDADVSVWYRWVATGDGEATFDTVGSSFDTVIHIYTGSALEALSLVVANDDAGDPAPNNRISRVTFTAVEGTTYQIRINGYSTTGGSTDYGDITLNWVRSVPPPPGTNSIWYRAVPPGPGDWEMQYNLDWDFDAVYEWFIGGPDLASLEPYLAGSGAGPGSHSGYLNFIDGIDEAWLRWTGLAEGDEGTVTIEFTFTCAPPANDDWVNAEVLIGNSGSILGTTVCATSEVGEPGLS